MQHTSPWFIFWAIIFAIALGNAVWLDYRQKKQQWTRDELKSEWYKRNKVKK